MECKEGFGCTDQTNRHPGLVSPSDKYPYFVIPAQAGTLGFSAVSPRTLDPRLRGDDGYWAILVSSG